MSILSFVSDPSISSIVQYEAAAVPFWMNIDFKKKSQELE